MSPSTHGGCTTQGYFECLRIEAYTRKVSVTMACPGPVFSRVVQNAAGSQANVIYAQPQDTQNNRMQTARCARLMLVGLVNRLDELWIANQPVLAGFYLLQYAPCIGRWFLTRFLNQTQFRRIRDGE